MLSSASKRSTASSAPSPNSPAHVGSLSLSLFQHCSRHQLVLCLPYPCFFLHTCVSFPVPDAKDTWRKEAHFAAPPELALMCLLWGLARVSGGSAVHLSRQQRKH